MFPVQFGSAGRIYSTLDPFTVAISRRCTVSRVIAWERMLSVRVYPLSARWFQSLTHDGAPVNFINHQDPNHPKGCTAQSLLSNVTWPKYTLESKKMFLFSDDAVEEYTTVTDSYRIEGIAAIAEVQMELGV